MNQIEAAKKGIITDVMQEVAKAECVSPDFVKNGVKKGEIVIFFNSLTGRREKTCAVGNGLRTKVNANIGTSSEISDLEFELKKLEAAEKAGADAVMDLSTGGETRAIRFEISKKSRIPLGTVPVYEVIKKYSAEGFRKAKREDFLDVVRQNAEDGVDFVTIHAGLRREILTKGLVNNRSIGVVSRGGSFLTSWMMENEKENPYYEYFDDLLDISLKYDLVISLGDGLRPGAIQDATDNAQIEELKVLGELQKRALSRGVQTIIEGPGHIPIDQIQYNVNVQKELCNNAPFYVLGPIVTDIAPGYDHITSAIGGALAASYGADFLCYVTPAEHLGLPKIEDVKQGVIGSRIAAHAADLVKIPDRAKKWDNDMSNFRKQRDWKKQKELSIDPDKFDEYITDCGNRKDTCSMCAEYCSYKLSEKLFSEDREMETPK